MQGGGGVLFLLGKNKKMKLFRVSGHLIYESINAMAVHKRGNHNETN